MQFIRRIARTVTVFHQGAVLIEGDVADILANDHGARRLSRQAGRREPCSTFAACASGYGRIPIILTASPSQVADGEFVGILGHNGMGKTTLLKTLIGQLPATGGADPLRRTPTITRAPTHRRARLGLGYVPQGRQIFPGLSVLDNLRMGAASAGRRRRGARARCSSACRG